MQVRTFVAILFLVLALMVIVTSCATKRYAVSEDEFYKYWIGTWVNTDISGLTPYTPQKRICKNDKIVDIYLAVTNTNKICSHEFSLTEMWKDSGGNIWFKASEKGPLIDLPMYLYGKISDLGNTQELTINLGTEQIEKWEPDNSKYYYLIYYRQE